MGFASFALTLDEVPWSPFVLRRRLRRDSGRRIGLFGAKESPEEAHGSLVVVKQRIISQREREGRKGIWKRRRNMHSSFYVMQLEQKEDEEEELRRRATERVFFTRVVFFLQTPRFIKRKLTISSLFFLLSQ